MAETPLVQRAMDLLALDALALTTIAALERSGIDTLLLKGPVTSSWLYDSFLDREYTDVDLLVAPDRRGDAVMVMRDLGYHDHHARVLGVHRPRHESAWLAPGGAVDLHWALAGVPERSWGTAWQLLWQERTPFELHGRTVAAFGERGRLLNLALHAARSGPRTKARTELGLGLQRFGAAAWAEALELAEILGADAETWAAISREPDGRWLLARAGRTGSWTTTTVLHDTGALAEARSIDDLVEAAPASRRRELRRWLAADVTAPTVRARSRVRATAAARLARGVVQYRRARRCT